MVTEKSCNLSQWVDLPRVDHPPFIAVLSLLRVPSGYKLFMMIHLAALAPNSAGPFDWGHSADDSQCCTPHLDRNATSVEKGFHHHWFSLVSHKKNFIAIFCGWGSTASRLQSQYEEVVYFLPLSSQKLLVLIS